MAVLKRLGRFIKQEKSDEGDILPRVACIMHEEFLGVLIPLLHLLVLLLAASLSLLRESINSKKPVPLPPPLPLHPEIADGQPALEPPIISHPLIFFPQQGKTLAFGINASGN